MAVSEYQIGDRRPLATRQRRWAQRLAGRLARRGVSPNTISSFGMVFGCAAGALLGVTAHVGPIPARICWALAAGAVQLRLLCNMLDGMVAVEGRRASRVGELFNELPDRVSDAATLIGAGYSAGGLPVLGFVAACLALFTAYVRAEGKVAGANQEFCGPMAKPQRMFVVTVAALYCAVVPASWQPRWRAAGAGVMSIALAVIIIGTIITVVRRLRRIVRQLERV